jgi:pentatricopeptide repeat domain-containing protein 1
MQSSGCTPDVVTYTSLISAYERGGQWHLALNAFQRMLAQGCRPDAIVYNAIIDALWQTGVVWAQVGVWGPRFVRVCLSAATVGGLLCLG